MKINSDPERSGAKVAPPTKEDPVPQKRYAGTCLDFFMLSESLPASREVAGDLRFDEVAAHIKGI